MRTIKCILTFIITSIFLFSSYACGKKPEGEDNNVLPLYPQKENVINDRQLYDSGEIEFPDTLWYTPEFERAEEYDRPDCGAEGYFIKSVNFKGKATNVFVYVGLPDGASKANPVPGIVLVHGGGGTAFPDWVKTWTSKGYAAISVDTEGHVPTEDANVMSGTVTRESPKHHGPANLGFSDCNLEIPSQWCYHAISAVIVANSFLSSFEEVDSTKIGLTGISWGSVVVSNVACYDDRFAFCVPVYGGLAMEGTTGIFGDMYNNYPRAAELWDSTEPFTVCRTPMLFVNWNKDPFFTINATSKCAQAAQKGEMLLIDDLQHGHYQGSQINEIFVFADSVLQRNKIVIPQITKHPTFENSVLKFDSERSEIVYATLYTTTDAQITPETVWESTFLIPENGGLTLEIESEVNAFYVTLNDTLNLKCTTPIIIRN